MHKKLLLVLLTIGLLITAGCSNAKEAASSKKTEKLRFAVGPFQPTPGDTKKAYEPFIKYVSEQLGVDYEITTTNDWAGISVALSTGQADIAWMGPWSYILSNNESGAEAISTVKYDGMPTYHAIIVAGADSKINKFPDDAKGMTISFADSGSTSGWLIPTYYFQSIGINPKTYFKYSEGASHPANEISVTEGHVDLATDYDRNRKAMIETDKINETKTKIVWTSDPLPNDPIVVRKGFDADMKKNIQDLLINMTEEQAKSVLPEHYTGFVEATHDSYKKIEDAGRSTGKLK